MIERIGFVINAPREIDMYSPVVRHFRRNEYIFIVNDLAHPDDVSDMKRLVEDRNDPCTFLTQAYDQKHTYKVIVATRYSRELFRLYNKKSLFKYLYAKTVGSFIEKTGWPCPRKSVHVLS